jgi:hypothetical protein
LRGAGNQHDLGRETFECDAQLHRHTGGHLEPVRTIGVGDRRRHGTIRDQRIDGGPGQDTA